ncbi:phage tail protein I [Sporomusa sphaeroides DSM 2875]|uniref:phage tail protein I n=1 Tax=Sporomusa sphaeroides TaxID=47679 RepID=UPI00202F6395|nr:phage tail protein I [Sporomusa sphaeroides]MCM0759618.1 phage tail protein I [Sporomusa sphaeroides DSM 2875]
MVNISAIRLIDLVPPSIKDDPEVQAAAAALEGELQAVTAAIPTVLLISRIDELAEDVIDLLAWQWHVDFYEPGISLAQKRTLVKTSIAQHRRKGTPWAVEQVVKAILNEGIVQEWFEYGGEPYYFRVIKIDGQMPDAAIYTRLKKAIDTVKNTRSWLEGVALYRETAGTVYVGVAVGSCRRIEIMPATFRGASIAGRVYAGGVTYQFKGVGIQHA